MKLREVKKSVSTSATWGRMEGRKTASYKNEKGKGCAQGECTEGLSEKTRG